MLIRAHLKTLNEFYSAVGENALDCAVSWYGLRCMRCCEEFSWLKFTPEVDDGFLQCQQVANAELVSWPQKFP